MELKDISNNDLHRVTDAFWLYLNNGIEEVSKQFPDMVDIVMQHKELSFLEFVQMVKGHYKTLMD